MLIHLLIWILILGLVFYLAYWALSQVPLPAPFAVAARVILAIIVIIVLIQLVLPLAGTGPGCSRLFC